jgi:hypothetical protein
MTTDGHYVAFVGAVPGTASNLYMWDTQMSAIIYTNTSKGVLAVALSPDGQKIFFGATNGLYQIDRIGNTSTLLATNLVAARPGLHLSADGRFLAYAAISGTSNQIYAYDFQIGTNILVSRHFASGTNAFGNSDSPDISADGRYIAYRSFAEDIVTGDTNHLTDVFLYDQQTGLNTFVNVGVFGPADNQSRSPLFSSDGQILIFESTASDLIDNSFGFTPNLFVFSPYPPPVFAASITVDVQGAHLKWPVEVGKSYQVEFKDALSDPWQGLSGSVNLVGRKAAFDDLTLGVAQRFYRIVSF